MIQKTNMTIDAYLRNAGIKSAGTTNHKAFIPLKNRLAPSFSENLTTATSSNPSESIGKKTGLTISDYLDRATASASSRFFNNSTIRNGSLEPGGMNRLSNAFTASKERPTISDSASHGNSIEADAAGTSQTECEALIAVSIKHASRKYNLPEKLIENVIQAESNFRVDAVSPAGAQGLMQLMPGTAKELGVNDPFDVRQNIDGGAGYLRQMMDRFGGDVKLALAAYNAGPGTVEKYDGNVPYRETQNYIKRVLKGISA
jgi:Transglycosylase SLT domain